MAGTGTAAAEADTSPRPPQDGTPPTCERTWVGAWAGPDKEGDVGTLADQTFRMVVHTYLPGSRLRVRLTNALGTAPVNVDRAAVALAGDGAGTEEGTTAELSFDGQEDVVVPPGERVWSDPVSFALPADRDLAISAFAAEETGPLTGHSTSPALADQPPSLQATGEVRTSYLSPPESGDHTRDSSGAAFTRTTTDEMLIDGVDVMPETPTGAVVVLGDSISDGTHSTQDADRSWPDFLARRLLHEPTTRQMSVLNMGIAGNAVSGDGSGPSAVNRLERDVLEQSGVRAVILFEGINDLGFDTSPEVVQRVQAAVRQIVDRVHAAGLPIYAGLLTPTGDTTAPGLYSNPQVSMRRHQLNDWLCTPGLFDGTIDFDRVVRDPLAPEHWAPGMSRDQLHGNDYSYELMARAVDLTTLQRPSCRRP